jgi:hypothetical protein
LPYRSQGKLAGLRFFYWQGVVPETRVASKIAQCAQFFSENDKHLIINGISFENCAVFAHLLP